jgi:hypothetical protein
MPVSSDQIVIYVSPSLAIEEAREILDADYRPPIRRGDIKALMQEPLLPKIIGIIDGEFFQSFAISPKEILPAIEAGVIVLGSSSMGALRAAELQRFGMIGIGRIFEMYHSGELYADDEVAMVFDRDGGRPNSVPMVNIRIALEGARCEGIITLAEEQALVRLMKEVYFPDRTFQLMFRAAANAGAISELTAATLRQYLANDALDAKRSDAVRLLEEAKRIAATLQTSSEVSVLPTY